MKPNNTLCTYVNDEGDRIHIVLERGSKPHLEFVNEDHSVFKNTKKQNKIEKIAKYAMHKYMAEIDRAGTIDGLRIAIEIALESLFEGWDEEEYKIV